MTASRYIRILSAYATVSHPRQYCIIYGTILAARKFSSDVNHCLQKRLLCVLAVMSLWSLDLFADGFVSPRWNQSTIPATSRYVKNTYLRFARASKVWLQYNSNTSSYATTKQYTLFSQYYTLPYACLPLLVLKHNN